MGLPFIDEIPKSRTYIQEFRGYNHTDRCGENEFYDSVNLTNDNYPVLSTRKERNVIQRSDEYRTIAALSGDCCVRLVCNDNTLTFMYVDGEYEFSEEIGEYKENTRYHMVRMGANIIVLPQNYVFNTATHKGETFEYTINLKKGTLVNCLEDGTEIEIVKDVDLEKAKINDYYVTKVGPQYKVAKKIGDNEEIYVDVYVKVKGARLNSSCLIIKNYTLGVSINNDNCEKVISGVDWFAVYGYISYSRVEFSNKCVITYTSEGVAGKETSETDAYFFEYYYEPPQVDHIIECQNRLWACRFDGNINEIYATALGSYKDWLSLDSNADAAYVVSVGTPGAFTGAMTIGENPVFFKENFIHKVYVSSSGAHQLHTINCRGVQNGSSKSLVRVNESIIYKTKNEVVYFDGTNVTPISEALGIDCYTDAIAVAYKGKYIMWCKRENEAYMFVYDTKYGLWQRENAPESIDGMACFGDCFYIFAGTTEINNNKGDNSTNLEGKVPYMFESATQGFASPDGKYLIRIDYRISLGFGDTFNVFIQYDSDGKWHNVARLTGDQPQPKVRSLPIMPRRCDHFRIKVTGRGDMKLYSITKTYERGAEYGY